METIDTYKARIAVAGIRVPNGKVKSFTIVTHDGGELSLWPDKIGLIRADQEYEVEIAEKQGNGRVFHNIIGTPRHLGAYRPPTTDEQPTPKGSKKMDYWTPKPRDPHEQKQIWVCALLGREIEIGRQLLSDVELLARAKIHAAVWDELFGQRVTAEQP
jgi:hypothetical protein